MDQVVASAPVIVASLRALGLTPEEISDLVSVAEGQDALSSERFGTGTTPNIVATVLSELQNDLTKAEAAVVHGDVPKAQRDAVQALVAVSIILRRLKPPPPPSPE